MAALYANHSGFLHIATKKKQIFAFSFRCHTYHFFLFVLPVRRDQELKVCHIHSNAPYRHARLLKWCPLEKNVLLVQLMADYISMLKLMNFYYFKFQDNCGEDGHEFLLPSRMYSGRFSEFTSKSSHVKPQKQQSRDRMIDPFQQLNGTEQHVRQNDVKMFESADFVPDVKNTRLVNNVNYDPLEPLRKNRHNRVGNLLHCTLLISFNFH